MDDPDPTRLITISSDTDSSSVGLRCRVGYIKSAAAQNGLFMLAASIRLGMDIKAVAPVSTLTYGPAMTTSRLSPEDWIRTGFRSLVEQGATSLKAEALARQLKTTKGSFYWHFKDVPAFHAAMLSHWEEKAFVGIVDSLSTIPSPTIRLRMLAQMASAPTEEAYGGIAAEPALRAWAHENHTVADAVAKVDAQRLAYLADLLAELDVTNPDFARLIYGALIGMEDLSTRDQVANTPALETLIDLVLALR